MNISIMGVAIASIVGLLVSWLFLSVYSTQHSDFRSIESQVQCEKAQHDARFGDGTLSSKQNPELAARAQKVCTGTDKQLAARDAAEQRSDAERAEVKETIQSIFSNPKQERAQK